MQVWHLLTWVGRESRLVGFIVGLSNLSPVVEVLVAFENEIYAVKKTMSARLFEASVDMESAFRNNVRPPVHMYAVYPPSALSRLFPTTSSGVEQIDKCF